MRSDQPIVPQHDGHTETPTGSPSDTARTLGPYRLLRLLANGGMSTVYLAYDTPQRRNVALKVLADHLAYEPSFVERFCREGQLSRLFRHRNLVRGYATGRDASTRQHYFAMEFIDGPSAQQLIDRHGQIAVGEAVQITIDIAHALDYLHYHRYVHRDIKPSNILIHPDGLAKLADLGLAKHLEENAHLTHAHNRFGTPYYMPYEQSLNPTLVDDRSDIFALGASLYHMLTGRFAFQGNDHREIQQEKARGWFTPAGLHNPEVPQTLDLILTRMLQRDPRERFQTAREVIEVLEASGLAVALDRTRPILEADPAIWLDEAPANVAPTRLDLSVGMDEVPNPSEPGQESGLPAALGHGVDPTANPDNPVAEVQLLSIPTTSLDRLAVDDNTAWLVRYRNPTGAWESREATTRELRHQQARGELASDVYVALASDPDSSVPQYRLLQAYPEFADLPRTDAFTPVDVAPTSEVVARTSRRGTMLPLLFFCGALLGGWLFFLIHAFRPPYTLGPPQPPEDQRLRRQDVAPLPVPLQLPNQSVEPGDHDPEATEVQREFPLPVPIPDRWLLIERVPLS